MVTTHWVSRCICHYIDLKWESHCFQLQHSYISGVQIPSPVSPMQSQDLLIRIGCKEIFPILEAQEVLRLKLADCPLEQDIDKEQVSVNTGLEKPSFASAAPISPYVQVRVWHSEFGWWSEVLGSERKGLQQAPRHTSAKTGCHVVKPPPRKAEHPKWSVSTLESKTVTIQGASDSAKPRS